MYAEVFGRPKAGPMRHAGALVLENVLGDVALGAVAPTVVFAASLVQDLVLLRVRRGFCLQTPPPLLLERLPRAALANNEEAIADFPLLVPQASIQLAIPSVKSSLNAEAEANAFLVETDEHC